MGLLPMLERFVSSGTITVFDDSEHCISDITSVDAEYAVDFGFDGVVI
jgi:hypothetical protein